MTIIMQMKTLSDALLAINLLQLIVINQLIAAYYYQSIYCRCQ